MEKRLYIKPETFSSEIVLSHSILVPSEPGITVDPMTKEREDDELDIEKEAEKVPTEYSLW